MMVISRPVFRLAARAALGAAMIAGLVLLAGCGGRPSAAYYEALQVALLAEGLLRTETAPPGARYDAADLARNFERVALYSETDITRSGGEGNREPEALRRWAKPLKYNLFGSAVTPGDRAEVATLMTRITALTGLETTEADDDVDFIILITTPGERDAVSAELDAVNSGMSEIFDLWRRSLSLICAGTILRQDEDDYRILAALVVIGSETRDLMRTACLHEEIVQALGLPNDHPEVRPSIFNDDEEFALLTEHDEHLLRILYDPRLQPGMTAAEAMPIVREIAAGIPLDGPAAADGAAKQAVHTGT